tara:strand:+ start:2439 stop:2780 length:342 start_codon:yes stop_codon:yes gene_type:complete
MRKIERQMNFAISNKGNWKNSNTEVEFNENTNCSHVFLHGHNIATVDHATKSVKLSSCGWETVTTKSRLNAILQEVKTGFSIFQKQFEWFLNGQGKTVDFFDGMILLDSGEVA